MNPKAKVPARYVFQVVSLLFLNLVICAAGGISLVWLREQISDDAKQLQGMEQEMRIVQRRLQYMESKIAAAHHPGFLRQRSHELGLGLTTPDRRQVVHLEDDYREEEGEEERREALPYALAETEPVMTSFELALFEPLRGGGE